MPSETSGSPVGGHEAIQRGIYVSFDGDEAQIRIADGALVRISGEQMDVSVIESSECERPVDRNCGL